MSFAANPAIELNQSKGGAGGRRCKVMETRLQISYERLGASDYVKRRIEREVARLEKTFGRITSCRVAIEGPGHRQQKGGLYQVRVHLELPGDMEVSATRNPPQAQAHEDAYVAIRDAFKALRRRLRETVRARREAPQRPDTQPHGVVSKIDRKKGFGFIRSDNGRQIYFHKNSVLSDGFDRLRVGSEVHFAEEAGEQGPQASSVRGFGVGKREV
jgi:cold shock CspA family protein